MSQVTTPCVETTWPRDRVGYGRHRPMGVAGGQWFAHRWAWTQAHGPIPEGMRVLHRCDNPPCVNPDHLFLGTQLENIADRVAKGRSATGERQGQSKLTEAAVREIRAHPEVSTYEFARRFGVHHSTIHVARSGKKWKAVA